MVQYDGNPVETITLVYTSPPKILVKGRVTGTAGLVYREFVLVGNDIPNDMYIPPFSAV